MIKEELKIIINLLAEYESLLSQQRYSDNDEGDYYERKDNRKRSHLLDVIKTLKVRSEK